METNSSSYTPAYLEKRQMELKGLLHLKDSTQKLVLYLQHIETKMHELNTGMEVMSHVVENWERVFSNLADSHPETYVKKAH
mmetsp:Transcript_16191/g.29116  ORF Transcript_16191/g.29116 Transcript_16191/m.29116 type:complete len:82 (-) Transcript_16191:433-678(-)